MINVGEIKQLVVYSTDTGVSHEKGQILCCHPCPDLTYFG